MRAILTGTVKIQVADKYTCNQNTHTPICLRNLCRDELAAQVRRSMLSPGFPVSTWTISCFYLIFSSGALEIFSKHVHILILRNDPSIKTLGPLRVMWESLLPLPKLKAVQKILAQGVVSLNNLQNLFI